MSNKDNNRANNSVILRVKLDWPRNRGREFECIMGSCSVCPLASKFNRCLEIVVDLLSWHVAVVRMAEKFYENQFSSSANDRRKINLKHEFRGK